MTRLSACYFCGLALDEPLADYAVVPDAALDDSSNVTVTLCETCEEKLDRVLEVVDSAYEGNTESPALHEDGDVDDMEGPNSHVGNKSDSHEGNNSGGPTDPLAAQTGADATDDLVDPDGGIEPESEPPTPDDAVETPRDDVDPVTSNDATADGGAAADGDAADDESPEHESPQDDTPRDDTPRDGSPAPEPTGDEPSEAESADDGDPAERSVVEGQHSISALEYNKVMRLLQNREFPVDREEIVTVAANAYGLGRSECAKVIDVAIDRGLIAEADGQLRKPDDA